MRMTRYWMTGCMALVLLVAGRWPVREELEETHLRQRSWITLTSKYDMDETVRQIEQSARDSGLPVLARTVADSPQGQVGRLQPAQVLVLGDEGGQTPVLQAASDATPELPWRVLVRPRPDGRADVLLTDPRGVALPDGVARDTQDKVAALPQMLRAAIT